MWGEFSTTTKTTTTLGIKGYPRTNHLNPAQNTPWAAKQLINKGVDAVIVFGWIGPSLTDKITYAVASMGLIMLQIEYDKPIIDVTVHEDEAGNEKELFDIAVDRSRKHARNLVLMLRGELTRWAGMGLRQGRPDVGPIVK